MPPLDFQSLDEDEPVDIGTLRQALATAWATLRRLLFGEARRSRPASPN